MSSSKASGNKILVYARTRFIGFHKWPEAPSNYRYLANLHRHEFHAEAAVRVTKVNREVEFHLLKQKVESIIEHKLDRQSVENWSCETWASTIGADLRDNCRYTVEYVDVSEDNENGARVYFGGR